MASVSSFETRLKRTRLPKSKVVDRLLQKPELAIRELNNRSFYHFLKFMWPAISDEKFIDNWHISYICDRLQALAEQVATERNRATHKRPINDLVLNVPPGTTKTSMVSILFPAWCWTRWYWMEFICLSYGSGLSLESAETCRDLIRSDRFQAVYPDLSIKTDKDQKSNFQLLKQFTGKPGYSPSTKLGGSRYSTSVGGTLTGFHGHMILVDDPVNPEQAVSPVQLESANRWLDSTLPTRKVHKVCSPVVTIMQRLHEDDPTGHKLERKDNVDHICLPGEIRDYEDQVKPGHLKEHYSPEGLLDPVRMGWDVLDDLKADLGQYGYAGQVGQSPTPPTGGMFEVDKLRIVDSLPPQREIEQIIRYWDKAGTESKKGQSKHKGPAWSVGVKMAKLRSGDYLIIDVLRGRWSSGDREKMIKKSAESDGKDVYIWIEQEPGSGGKESAESTIKNLAGWKARAERPTGNKVTRADPFSVQVNWGNVQLLRGEWNSTFIEELRFFPNSTFKDQVDSAAGAFNALSKAKSVRVLS